MKAVMAWLMTLLTLGMFFFVFLGVLTPDMPVVSYLSMEMLVVLFVLNLKLNRMELAERLERIQEAIMS